MMQKHLLLLSVIASWTMAAACLGAEEEGRDPYNQILLGYGSSHPGWGETTERVQTVDVVFRHCRHFFEKDTGWIKGTHEFWIEAPVSILLSDSDSKDRNDFGIVGLNFLFAWIFPEIGIGEPYFIIGGGPQYMFADIEGVGSDLCGNYQAGGGIRLNLIEDHPINLELRFHHISNLGFAEPNVPLNSSKAYIGFMLPF